MMKQLSADESFEMIREGIFRCNGCGKEVESGIFNISGHWVECTGKEFTQGLFKVAESNKGKITQQDLDELLNSKT